MRLFLSLVVLSCIGVLGGCANPRSLVPGQSTEADVRARMGNPTDTRVDRNGERLWEYALGPEGAVTYIVRTGADGKVKEVTQVLTEEQFAKVVPGMTQSDVRNILGRPFEEVRYMPGMTWSWRILFDGVQQGWLIVTFSPDGTVKDKLAHIEPSGGGREN